MGTAILSVGAALVPVAWLSYVVLVAAILAGLWVTLVFNAIERAGGGGYDYRATVGPWFRSLFVFQPDTARMAAAPVDHQVHTVIGMLLFMLWPFTRLVHAFTAQVGYLFRPYLVYRSRDARRTAARGWSPVGTPDRRRAVPGGGWARALLRSCCCA